MTGIDDNDDYGDGWGPRGERFEVERRGRRTQRVSFIAAWHQNTLIAPMTDEGYCNRTAFEAWL